MAAGSAKVLPTDQGLRDRHGREKATPDMPSMVLAQVCETHRMQPGRQLGPPIAVPVGHAHAWMASSLLVPLDHAWASTL